MTSAGSKQAIPGRCLLGVPPALAALTIAFNVFYLRRFHPGVISGKLSDVGINFFLPVLLMAVSEWVKLIICVVRRRSFTAHGRLAAAIATLSSASYFAALKLVPGFTPWHVALLRAVAAPFPVNTNFRNLTDPTDLITLLMAPLAYVYLVRSSSGHSTSGTRARSVRTPSS